MIFIIIPTITANAQKEEYTIKTVYIEKFTRFITWPDSILTLNTDEPLVFSIYGDTPISEIASEIFSTHTIKGKKVEFRLLNNLDDINSSHILFISKIDEKELEKLLETVSGKPILTISDTKNYEKKGVMINFIITSGRINFIINKASINKTPLHFSHLLLKQAAKLITK